VNVPPALSALSGGPRLGGTLDDLARPSREMVWRHLRALRHQPPWRASGGEHRRVFGAALEQAQQLFTAAASVDYASRPILVFYGLSQAGRAIAACSTKAGKNEWRLAGTASTYQTLTSGPNCWTSPSAIRGAAASHSSLHYCTQAPYQPARHWGKYGRPFRSWLRPRWWTRLPTIFRPCG
jgi:hypothetical protein